MFYWGGQKQCLIQVRVYKQYIHPRSLKIAPEKWWLEDYFPIGKAYFQGRALKLPGWYFLEPFRSYLWHPLEHQQTIRKISPKRKHPPRSLKKTQASPPLPCNALVRHIWKTSHKLAYNMYIYIYIYAYLIGIKDIYIDISYDFLHHMCLQSLPQNTPKDTVPNIIIPGCLFTAIRAASNASAVNCWSSSHTKWAAAGNSSQGIFFLPSWKGNVVFAVVDEWFELSWGQPHFIWKKHVFRFLIEKKHIFPNISGCKIQQNLWKLLCYFFESPPRKGRQRTTKELRVKLFFGLGIKIFNVCCGLGEILFVGRVGPFSISKR